MTNNGFYEIKRKYAGLTIIEYTNINIIDFDEVNNSCS